MIGITGYSGFVGKNLTNYLHQHNLSIKQINRQSIIQSNFSFLKDVEVLVHLSGKAHDLKNVSSFEEYYQVNTNLTIKLFDAFINSDAKVFITLSSVKAVLDVSPTELTEEDQAIPITHYGKSKLLAEQYILSKQIPHGKKVFILRPCMIHGPGNKGNLNLLYNIVSHGLPWPLGKYENSRSYLSVENLCFIIMELILRDDISSGIYNVADDIPISTNDVVRLIAESKGQKAKIIKLSKMLINSLATIGDFLKLPINTERLIKLTENYIVSNTKIKSALGKQLPISSREGLLKTFKSFSSNA
jgi:nucleoside-diphosphate-sugar epimerase